MPSSTKAITIAAISSPSSTTEMSLDILQAATKRKLVGSLVYFDLDQEGRIVRVTGQITDLMMRNSFHEQSQFKNALKTRGEISSVSGVLDIHTATMSPGSIFGRLIDGNEWGYEVLGTVPASGTKVMRLSQEILDELLVQQKPDVCYLGRAYGDDSVALPMTMKHFGDPRRGGQGEASHMLIVGKTGSGKSTVAKMLIGLFAKHPLGAILIVDPKGEFGDEIAGYGIGDSGLPFAGMLKGYGRTAQRYGITQVRFEGYELFEDVMISLGLDKDLNIRGVDNKLELALAFVEIIKARPEMDLKNLRGASKLVTILKEIRGEDEDEDTGYLSQIYKSEESQDSLRKQIDKIIANPTHRIYGTWDFLTFLFEEGDGSRPTIGQIVNGILRSEEGERPLIVLDLSVSGNRRDFADLGDTFKSLQDANDERDLFTDGLQKKILYRIMSDLRRLCETVVSERIRIGDKTNVNTLVVLEEAHRFAPRNLTATDEDSRKLKTKLIESVRETRKYGLGFCFIDQTIGGLDKEIIQQVRSCYIGYGLSMGEELSAVKDMIGGDQRDISLYRSFKDPASFGKPSDKKFPWMAFGPVSPMAANHPLFFNAFHGEEFISRNNLAVDRSNKPLRLPVQTLSGKRLKASNIKTVSLDDVEIA